MCFDGKTGVAAGANQSPSTVSNGYTAPHRRTAAAQLARCDRPLESSASAKCALGARLRQAFVAVKPAEWERMAHEVSEAEWALYEFTVRRTGKQNYDLG
jgi:glutamine synthetase